MYLSQRYSLEDFNEVLDKNNPEVFKIKNKTKIIVLGHIISNHNIFVF